MGHDRRSISDLHPGETVDEVYLIRDKDLRRTQSGSMYVSCTVADSTGTAPGRMWKASESAFQAIPAEGFGRLRGRTDSYRGQLQIVIEGIDRVDPESVDLGDFLPASKEDPAAMWQELEGVLRSIENPHVLRLVEAFVDDASFVERFKSAPAAAQMHHAYIGGLLEHTRNVVRLAKVVAPLYPESLNVDLLVAGAFLHDIGKIEELRADVSMGYTDRGNLVGHIVAAAIWLEQRAAEVAKRTGRPFPAEVLDLLQHMVLAHHGVLEYGSPKVPAIPEAMVLHYLDNLDAKTHMFDRAREGDQDDKSTFTGYSRPLGSRVFKRSTDLPE